MSFERGEGKTKSSKFRGDRSQNADLRCNMLLDIITKYSMTWMWCKYRSQIIWFPTRRTAAYSFESLFQGLRCWVLGIMMERGRGKPTCASRWTRTQPYQAGGRYHLSSNTHSHCHESRQVRYCGLHTPICGVFWFAELSWVRISNSHELDFFFIWRSSTFIMIIGAFERSVRPVT